MTLGFRRFQKLLGWVGFLLVSLTFISCSSVPSLAGTTPVDAKLEAQVLQIIRDHPEVILESVQKYQQQQQQKQQESRQSFLEQTKTNPKQIIGQSPTLGSTAQKIVLVEFSDFQCPFCAKASETLKEFMTRHGKEVTLTYKHLPLVSIHPEAMPAAKAAWAAAQQGKFWEYHDALFDQQDQLGEPLYLATAQALKLNLERFNRDRKSEAASKAIQQDLAIAQTLGIEGTPFFVMNGETFSGAVPLSEMENILAKVRP
jgi:protein-disulfide isomerase